MIGIFIAHVVQQAILFSWVFPVLIIAESLLPRGSPRAGHRLRALGYWTVYVCFSATFISCWGTLLAALSWHPLLDIDLTPSGSGISKAALVIAAAIVSSLTADFFYYWCHRAQHRFFWRFHAIHHSIRDLNAVNSYHHWTEDIIRLPFLTLPLSLLVSVHAQTGMLLAVVLTLQTWWIHSPVRMNVGPLRRLLNNNHVHRIHHSLEPRHFEKNFGGFSTVWDQMFGTAYFPAIDEWPDVGIADAGEPRRLADYLLRPFRAAR